MPIFEFRRDLSRAATPKDLLSFANQAAGQSPGAVLEVGPPTLEENPPHSQIFSFPAPTSGIKDAVLGSESSALRMRNFWPTDRGLEIRNGYQILTNFVGEDNDPLALIAHEHTNKVLAVYPATIYAYDLGDGTSTPLSHAPGIVDVVSSVSMRTELNVLTVMVTGKGPMIVYDGKNTVEIPRLRINTDFALPSPFLDTSTVNVVWLYGKRMFLASKTGNSAWYFDINAVPYSGVGADDLEQVTELPLGNVFPRGGILNGGFSWSVDVGDNLNNRCVFTSNQGEFAIYSGDPDVDFVLDGLYVSGSLLSSNTLFSVGGDAYMLLDTGFKLLSEIVRGSPTGGEIGSLEEGSYIALRKALNLLEAEPGDHIVAYFRLLDMAILVNRKATESDLGSKVIAYNTKLKAWTEFTGWNIRAITVFGNSRLLFLDHAGNLCQAWKGSSDGWGREINSVFGVEYTAFVRYTFSPMRELALKKTCTAVQGVWDNTTKVCPAYYMVGHRTQKELPPPLVCPPQRGLIYWGEPPVVPVDPVDPVGPVDPRIAVTSSTLDVRDFSIIGDLTYKVGGEDAGAHGPNTPGAFAFEGVILDTNPSDIPVVVKRVPLFVAFDSNHAGGTTPVWSAYVMTLDDEAALGAAVTDELRPPADSIRGWRELNVGTWDTDDGEPEGFIFPALDFDSSVANRVVGNLLPSQTVSPYAGHATGVSQITAIKGMWLAYGGDFWVRDPTSNSDLTTDPAVSRKYTLFRPRAEVDAVTAQLAQDFGDLDSGKRGIIHFYLDGFNDGDEADVPPYSRVAGSSLVGRWFSVTTSVTRVGLFGPVMYRWVIGQQIIAPTNVSPNMIPADYDNA